MRNYIIEKVTNTPLSFKFGGVTVDEFDPMPDSINAQGCFAAVEDIFPRHYYQDLQNIEIGHRPEFDERNITALYDDGVLYLTNQQKSDKDLLDDIIHEFAHHLEEVYTDTIYGDQKVIKEFRNKRQQLNFELRSEGYWTQEYDFKGLKYNEELDNFLYKRIGKPLLKMITSGLFVRPYASVSLREYFATGFEAFYMGQKDKLKKISPILYNKVEELHNLS
tara:strand:- start:179 stop:841 length:663 start_codon:yes stop_codon:yes gene_type:complete